MYIQADKQGILFFNIVKIYYQTILLLILIIIYNIFYTDQKTTTIVDNTISVIDSLRNIHDDNFEIFKKDYLRLEQLSDKNINDLDSIHNNISRDIDIIRNKQRIFNNLDSIINDINNNDYYLKQDNIKSNEIKNINLDSIMYDINTDDYYMSGY